MSEQGREILAAALDGVDPARLTIDDWIEITSDIDSANENEPLNFNDEG